ncbi:helix-turn-helix domain-containing protein [Photobacterium nomapromontoriensis]|uniref:hybrid sensor histidine kinase/response regulator transcription factor n=1 Tax=Photobacterium nomapromontoriensis TaxID=2910237 RepID=UPI003D0C7B2C
MPINKPGNMIIANKVIKDTQRGLWVVDTRGALYFYDGLSLKPARDGEGQPINKVEDAVMAGRQLWLLKDSEAYYYSPATTELLRLNISSEPIESIASNGDGVWFANRRGLYQLTQPELPPKIVPFQHPLKLYGLYVVGNSVFVAVKQGVYEYAIEMDTKPKLLLPEQQVTSIVQDPQGQYWFGTLTGLFRGPSGEQVHLDGVRDNLPISALQMTENGLWIGTKNGLYLYDLITFQQRHFLPSDDSDFTLTGRRIIDLELDAQGALWVATPQGISYQPQVHGLLKRLQFGNESGQINARRINDIEYTSNGSYWLATDNGLVELSPFMDIIRHDTSLGNIEKIDAWQQELWILSDSKVRIYSRQSHRWETLSMPAHIRDGDISSLLVDHYGSVWLGMVSQLYRYWPDSNEWVSFGQHWLRDPMGDEAVTVILEDSEYQIWVGTDYGLYQFEAGHLYLVAETVDQGGVLDLYEDRMGQLWVANRYTLQYSQTLAPLVLRSIPLLGGKAYPHCIVGDGKGIWVTTTNGLVNLSYQGHMHRHFSRLDGIIPNEFYAQACQRTEIGRLLFGSKEGVVAIQPEQLMATKANHLPLAVSAVRVNNQLHQLGGAGQEKMSVPYGSMVSIELSVPTERPLSYRLIADGNVSSDWQSLNSHYLQIESLFPGSYQLEVIFDGQHSGDGDILRYSFIVERPWYLSVILISAFVLIAVVIFFVHWYWRRRIGSEQNQQVKQAVYKKTAKIEMQKKLLNASNMQLQRILEIRQNMMAQLSHELRTPLHLSLSLLAALRQHDQSSSKLDVVEKNITHSLHVTEQLLSCDALALIEPKKRYEQRVGPILQACCMSWQAEAEKKQIALCLEDSTSEVSVFLAPYHLEVMLGNLLSNALKYTDRKGGITVNVTEVQAQLVISVSDTGQGMTDETKAHLFESYYQEDPIFNIEAGFGLGLSTVKQLVELYHGDISVISYQGVGSEFIVRLPVYRSSMHSAEILPDQIESAEELPSVVIASASTDSKECWISLLRPDFQLTFVEDGYEALIAMQDQAPDMLITDLVLPGLNGTQLLQRLADELPADYNPRLILVAEENAIDHSDVLMAGWAHAVLSKPVDVYHAFMVISKLLNIHRDMPIAACVDEESTLFWRDSVKALVTTHLHLPSFGSVEAAKALNMSERTLLRKFKQEFGLTFKDYIIQYRLAQAALMLKQGDQISDVVLACGFKDLSSFCARFKNHTGLTPAQFAHGAVSSTPVTDA